MFACVSMFFFLAPKLQAARRTFLNLKNFDSFFAAELYTPRKAICL